MVTIVIDRRSVHAGDDLHGHAHRWEAPDGLRLGEVVLASVERRGVSPFMGGGTWLIQAVHDGVVEDVAGWGLEVDAGVGEWEDLAIVEGYPSVRREVRQPGGGTRTEIVPVGVESYTVRPMMSESDLRRRVVDAVRPGPGGEHVFFASTGVERPRPWETFQERVRLPREEAARGVAERAVAEQEGRRYRAPRSSTPRIHLPGAWWPKP